MEKLKVLSLFSGIGGIDLGLERTQGFQTIAFVEIDKDCQEVLRKHWPKVPIFENVEKVGVRKKKDGSFFLHEDQGSSILRRGGKSLHMEIKDLCLESHIDMIVGGFPCTDISVAGKQKGLIDSEGNITRSGLWFQYKRLIEEINPKYVLIENVQQLLNNGMMQVLKDLDGIGYDCEWQVISARDVGACHLRKRIWILAWPREVGSEE